MKRAEPRSRSFDKDVSDLLGRGFLSMAFQPIVETSTSEEDGRALSELGISYGQGFWLGTPKPAEEWLDGSDRKNLWRKAVDAVHIRH